MALFRNHLRIFLEKRKCETPSLLLGMWKMSEVKQKTITLEAKK
jgi:hypothetical protein